MQYYCELRRTLRRDGPIQLVPLDDLQYLTGFRSVYAYTEEVARTILEAKTTSILRGQPVYSDMLLIDFDAFDPAEFRKLLLRNGIAFQVWDSGNRSIHFHIPIVPMFGPDVPSMQKAWVKQHAPDADISFYHAAGIYRLPGTYHAKNPGHCKKLLEERSGSALEITATSAGWTPRTGPILRDESRLEDFNTGLLKAVGEGGRRPYVWKLATIGAEAGLTFDEVVEKISWWNSHLCHPPHSQDAIIKQIESAFRRLERIHATSDLAQGL